MKVCPGGVLIEKKPYETIRQFQKRERDGICASNCRKLHGPAAKSHTLPSLPFAVKWVEGESRAVPKTRTPRDKKFLRWLSTRPCELRGGKWGQCQGDVVGHHTETGGVALKGSDYSAIPVCHPHHLLFDAATKKGKGIFTKEELAAIIERNVRDWNDAARVQKRDTRRVRQIA